MQHAKVASELLDTRRTACLEYMGFLKKVSHLHVARQQFHSSCRATAYMDTAVFQVPKDWASVLDSLAETCP
jgi:hypothetical protein